MFSFLRQWVVSDRSRARFYRLTFSFRRDVAFLKGISRHSGGSSGIHLKLLRLIFYLVVSPLVIFFHGFSGRFAYV